MCVRGACDNYTMVCVCFSWALSFFHSPLTLKAVGGGKDRRAIMRCLEQLSQARLFLFFWGCNSTKSRGRL